MSVFFGLAPKKIPLDELVNALFIGLIVLTPLLALAFFAIDDNLAFSFSRIEQKNDLSLKFEVDA